MQFCIYSSKSRSDVVSNYLSNTLNISCVSKYETCVAACALQLHFSSCSVMCPRTAAAVVGRRVVRCRTSVTHSRALADTRGEGNTQTHVRAHSHTLRRLSQKSHVLQEPWRGGEERRMTSSDISISAIKDTTALKVSRCAVRNVSDQKPHIYHRNYIKHP